MSTTMVATNFTIMTLRRWRLLAQADGDDNQRDGDDQQEQRDHADASMRATPLRVTYRLLPHDPICPRVCVYRKPDRS
jgi:hypothetical protein